MVSCFRMRPSEQRDSSYVYQFCRKRQQSSGRQYFVRDSTNIRHICKPCNQYGPCRFCSTIPMAPVTRANDKDEPSFPRRVDPKTGFSPDFHFSNRCSLEDCFICEDSYAQEPCFMPQRRYDSRLSDEEAKAVIQGHIKCIDESFAELSTILSSHGDNIMSMWTKTKDKKKRETLVHSALPDGYPTEKWILLFAYVNHSQKKPSAGDRGKHRQSFLLPFIGREELITDRNKLLRLLDLRTEYPPWQWARMDHAATECGRGTGMLAMRFNETLFSMQENDYGKPVDYEYDMFHRREAVGFPVAEIFLCSIAKLLLEKYAKSEKAKDKSSGNSLWKKQSTDGFSAFAPIKQTLNPHPFYQVINPYEPPLQFDIPAARSILEERQSAGEDELWLLQTDISSAYSRVEDLSRRPPYSVMTEVDRWAHIAQDLCEPLMMKVGSWNRLDSLFHLAEGRMRNSSSESHHELDVLLDWAHTYVQGEVMDHQPHDLSELLLKDVSFVNSFSSKNTSGVKDQSFARTALFVTHYLKQGSHEQSARYYKEQPFTWAVTVIGLATNGLRSSGFLLDLMFSFLNDLVQDGVLKLENESAHVVEAVKTFSATLQLRANLDARRPRFLQLPLDTRRHIRSHVWKKLAPHVSFGKVYQIHGKRATRSLSTKQERTNNFKKAGLLLKQFFDINLSTGTRKRTVEWLEKAEQSKHALDAFWEEIRRMKINEASAGGTVDVTQVKQLPDITLLEHYQENEFLESVRLEKEILKAAQKEAEEKKKQKKMTKPSLKRPVEDQQESQTLWGDEKTSPKRSKAASGKPLKRNQMDEDPIPVLKTVPTATEVQEEPERIEVSPASLRVLARMWPYQSRAFMEERGTIRWKDFQAVMSDLGFQASGVGGSKIAFDSQDKGNNRERRLHSVPEAGVLIEATNLRENCKARLLHANLKACFLQESMGRGAVDN
ncbi:hypothetical protein M409DRAFT_56922 [Zasmidium cellare ATCC 36951]|uniref:Clr5 domain-containing protein n=1 Tax=Zasmidium cellare ATCC 36951 TaxID=1080233 RepID=A0A6A6CB26_ZASCE|nr:uncharacterized protein M409DRAFT_56922 [Zasmidium cellare ATCC 36951]KAF2164235.1 hypothetical protein M409DRAFT_56922 [Zasmidium cellare ATCC 36951]